MLTVPSMASDKRLRKVPGSDFGLAETETAFRVSVVGGGAASQVVSFAGRPTSQGRTPADAILCWAKRVVCEVVGRVEW
jgi:hypothetical protein